MVDRNLIRELTIDETELDQALAELGEGQEAIDSRLVGTIDFTVNEIIDGVILKVDTDEVLVDIGFKSEGVVPRDEWNEEDEQPEVGQTIQVLLEEIEDSFDFILLSKRKADRVREWEKIIVSHAEGDVVNGNVVRKIKGGLLVNIGVNVFLPASQVDIRRPSDIANYIGQEIQCVILKIDEARRNIVVSRRKLIEDERDKMKKELLEQITEGERRNGVVKNIADFGAFVDLGGIDGLLHITDMSWGRINHPTEMVKIDEEIEVVILSIDREREKIALGLKQKEKSPWEKVDDKYPVGTKTTGEVVNVMSYGAFVKLEDGIEGLVHISEMSWTKRINHPTELVNTGDEVEIVVLGINQDKQEISLGMKQTQPNPWDQVAEKYPTGETVNGTVRNLTNYGAFVELEEGVDGLLHVSDMSWTRKISHANEMLKKGDPIQCQVLSVDENRKRIALGLKQLAEDPWEKQIPEKFQPGAVVTGSVTKITNFGVFVQLDPELEGLLHISELADHKVENPEDVVQVGEELEVRILRVDSADRKIGLSRKLTPDETEADSEAPESESAPAVREELKGGMGGDMAGPMFMLPGSEAEAADADTDAESTDTAPADAESTDTASTDAESTDTASADAESTDTASTDAESTDTASTDAESTTEQTDDAQESEVADDAENADAEEPADEADEGEAEANDAVAEGDDG